MNTSQIKNFAIQSRNILKTGVIQRIQILGFDANGNLTKGEPTRIDIQGGATLFAGEIFDGAFYDRWMSIRRRIQEKGVKEVYEEAAYTWFNRLVAIRIMQKNGFIDPVLAYTNEQTRIPRIVAEARAGRVGQMTPADREKLRDLMGDDARINEQFAILIENFCRNNAVIFNCFGGIEEYIALLLPDNILAPGGFIDLLNHTSYITDEDYKQSELIGWLYQFYISEKKDEVFAKQGKYDSDEIPAATQIFTPNWIVKYMVQNTIGRIYLDNNPWATGIKEQMKYLVEPAVPTPKDAILKLESVEDYKLLDNACGSGHILVEGFALFYKMYLEEGYSSRNAIESILRKNLIGIDLDTRAKQLATFALLMTAAKLESSFLDCKVMPRVMDMPGRKFSKSLYEIIRDFYMGDDKFLIDETLKAFELLEKADTLGSIMKFDISAKTRAEMSLRYKEWEELLRKESFSEEHQKSCIIEVLPSIAIILALTDRYTAVVTNPPYMGSSAFNDVLSPYVKNNYPLTKADLGTVFMDVAYNLLCPNGTLGMINQSAWANKSSYVEYRSWLVENISVVCFLDLGSGTFDEIKGEVVQSLCFIFKRGSFKMPGKYFNLSMYPTSTQKRDAFIQNQCPSYNYELENVLNIPSFNLCYWLSGAASRAFKEGVPLNESNELKKGLATGKDNLFLRLWPEVSVKNINFNCKKLENNSLPWITLCKGGGYRKWYGNNEHIIFWKDNGYAIKNFRDADGSLLSRPQNLSYMLSEAISYNIISSREKGFVGRMLPANLMMTDVAPNVYGNHLKELIGFLNSTVGRYFCTILCPSYKFETGYVGRIPILEKVYDVDSRISEENILIAKTDWDAHENSWNYKENELVRVYKENHGDGVFMDANKLEDIVAIYKEYWTGLFYQLHANEEGLNRKFIEIYGLQDELTPDVPLDEITILQQGEISVENGQLVWHNDVLVKQLLSYAIGCMMGRYRLDRPGLHIAYPNPSAADIETYDFLGEKFEIDDDGIIPLLSRDCPFDDNAYNRVVKFIRQVFGDSFLNENLNFIEDALGKTIENYFVKDFWKDHKKMYSNRPIYWLFSSKKGAFQCLTYMHRMNPYTAEAVRSKYLLPYIDFLKNKIAADMERASSLSTVERKNLDKMQAALDECLEYEELLHDVADRQIRFDLDDGVVVNYAKFGDVLAKIK